MVNIYEHNYKEYIHKVLLVEDNIGDARLVELVLEESELFNCAIKNVNTLADGIAEASSDHYDAVLLDLSLPDSAGLETLKDFVTACPNANIIVLTGTQDNEIGANAVLHGAQDYLTKGKMEDALPKSLRYSTTRKRVIESLKETQRIAKVANWSFNLKDKLIETSDQGKNILDTDSKEFSLKEIKDKVIVEDQSLLKEMEKQILEKKEIQQDIRIKTSTGEIKYLFISCQAVFENSGNLVLVKGILQDITERKLTELEGNKNRLLYESIFTQSKDAIYVNTEDKTFRQYNTATETLLGFTEEELKNIDIHGLFEIVNKDEYGNSFQDYLNNLPSQSVKDFEITIKRKDGKRIHCLVSTQRMAHGMKGFHGIIRDITERKQAEELRKEKDVAEQAAKLKERFLASVSHEMRTPMNAIKAISHLLLDTKLSTKQYEDVSSIKQSADNLLGIINDILNTATLQFGDVEFKYQNFDIISLLKNLPRIFHAQALEKKLSFKLDIGKNIDTILIGDKSRLNQILINLIGNSMKFTEQGSVTTRVRKIKETTNKAVLRFEIIDTGIGIPKDKLGVVFETFTRVTTKEKLYEGTGLGLSIVKKFVELQGGKVGVTSILGQGSTFFFELPFEKGNEEKFEQNQTQNIKGHTEIPKEEIKILLVEDNKMNQMVARRTIKKQGDNIKIVIADNGKIATEKMTTEYFDLVLMDIQMPVMDGYEATKFIREQLPEPINKTPILAMTADAHIARDNLYKIHGMDDYVLKPFEPSDLINKIAYYAKQSIKKRTNELNRY